MRSLIGVVFGLWAVAAEGATAQGPACPVLARVEVLAVDLAEGRVALANRSVDPPEVVTASVGEPIELAAQRCCSILVVESTGPERVTVRLECFEGRREGWLEGIGAATRFVELRPVLDTGPGSDTDPSQGGSAPSVTKP